MALLYGNHEHGIVFRSLFNLFIMNTKSFETVQLVHEYLTTTDDALSSNVCRAFGLSQGKHFLYDLRVRMGALDSLQNAHNGNLPADGPIGSSLSAPATLKRAIFRLSDEVFNTHELRNLANLTAGNFSRTLRKLECEGLIERVSFTRPYQFRRCPQIRPDFTKVFMEVHGLIDPPSSIPLRHLPILANRALCGKSIDGMELMKAVTDMASRYSRISLPLPPTRALEPFLLAVLKGAGDYRAVTRELEKVLREAKAIRGAFDRLSSKGGFPIPLAGFTMPHEWFSLFEQPGKISSFVEAITDALGAELHPKEAESVTDQAIEKTLEELRNQGIAGRYDPLEKAMIDISPSFHDLALSILHDNIRKYVKKVDLPVRKFNVKELYRKVALEMVQDKIGGSAGWNKYTTYG